MSKRSRSSLGSNPLTCWSVMRSVSTPRGMQCPQPKKTAGTFRPLERGLQLFGHDLQPRFDDPRDVPAWPRETGHIPQGKGVVVAGTHDDGDRVGGIPGGG